MTTVVNHYRLKLPVIYCLLVLLAGMVVPVVFGAEDPIVLQVGSHQVSRSELARQFDIAMVMSAVQEATPIKSGMQIRDLRERFLQNRVAEMLLLQLASQRNITVSEPEVNAAITDYLDGLQQQYGATPAFSKDEDLQIKTYLHEQLILRKLKQSLITEHHLSATDASGASRYLNNLIQNLRTQTDVHTYPEQLD